MDSGATRRNSDLPRGPLRAKSLGCTGKPCRLGNKREPLRILAPNPKVSHCPHAIRTDRAISDERARASVIGRGPGTPARPTTSKFCVVSDLTFLLRHLVALRSWQSSCNLKSI